MGLKLVVIRWFCEFRYSVVALKAILLLVCLNRLVILRMCGEVKVKVALCALFSVCGGRYARYSVLIWCFSSGGG